MEGWKSNIFRVRDPERFKKFLLKDWGDFPIEIEAVQDRFELRGSGAIPELSNELDTIDFIEELGKHLAVGEIAIFVEDRIAIAIDYKSRVKTHSLADFYRRIEKYWKVAPKKVRF